MTAAVVTGVGGWVPPRVVTNAEVAARLDTTEEWIATRTGVRTRHWVEPGTSTVDLAVLAGERALKSAGVTEVGAVVLATTTPDRLCPASAPEVAARLGLGPVAAFDVGAVCAGFVYALAVSAGLIGARVAESVLVIGADTFSSILDPADRGTAMIFGDGAGAFVLRAGDSAELGALGPFDLGSDGELADLIMIPGGGSRDPAPEPGDRYFAMQGKATFQHAVRRMATSSQAVLEARGWRADDVDWLVGHQANRRILDALADAVDLPRQRLVSNIDRVGNTSAASIPLAIADALAPDPTSSGGPLAPGDNVLLTAFGGGLAWGSTALRWPAVGQA
ncbi:beta-ketoacyl-ACP synthase III [Actinokineospora globicatena]|uniref:beta-ketoacyl-ACP synthase III n=1 Tax=Actinokineospora globicatena TaxID=103729 RepID=UPI0020A49686|nr:beta-ketoacyl-ACP synthase III [Actinokineospora globicatena]MCP2303562.1 3-oxoacyl-[acyl-carrier-protein] synthase III (EC 2.3.1.41) [Actinokineospora globicatena]GLW79301.1 3-oxoacyl-[acyl-carrier-protein] synthase 3 [Actinokineospora globicatena]GLW86289.1 3-oxoacyl-[acyl-carrier-protein] synthase 3 [Actinokineospora globicatena]